MHSLWTKFELETKKKKNKGDKKLNTEEWAKMIKKRREKQEKDIIGAYEESSFPLFCELYHIAP